MNQTEFRWFIIERKLRDVKLHYDHIFTIVTIVQELNVGFDVLQKSKL